MQMYISMTITCLLDSVITHARLMLSFSRIYSILPWGCPSPKRGTYKSMPHKLSDTIYSLSFFLSLSFHLLLIIKTICLCHSIAADGISQAFLDFSGSLAFTNYLILSSRRCTHARLMFFFPPHARLSNLTMELPFSQAMNINAQNRTP